MNKTLILLSGIMLSTMFATASFAMQFSPPVRVGSSSFNINRGGGHFFEGANKINATQYYNPYKKANSGYDKGYATFDNGQLYVHIEGGKVNTMVRVGAADKANTIETTCGIIEKINTDQDIKLYLLSGIYEDDGFKLIGRRADGRYVKYADGNNLFYQYFKLKGLAGNYRYQVFKDCIVFTYVGNGPFGSGPKIKLQWDDKAQWFGVERIQ